MTFCKECNGKKMCNRCNDQVKEIKKIEAKIKLIKRQTRKEFGYMLPYLKDLDDSIIIVGLLRRFLIVRLKRSAKTSPRFVFLEECLMLFLFKKFCKTLL